jgi:hypothetical protein
LVVTLIAFSQLACARTTYRELGKSVVGQFQLVYVCATDEDTYRIFVPWLRGSSDSCRFGGRRLVIMLHPADGFTMGLGSNRALLFCVFPLLVTSLAGV